MTDLERLLSETAYGGYAYAYPHKSAYRALDPPVPLAEAWADEPRDALFLYLHVPFCEMRCGFCNLFTTANPPEAIVPRYMEALEREAGAASEAVGPVRIARMAIGGGTPTYLDAAGLHRLFDLAEGRFGARLGAIPISVETSPATALPDRLRALAERGVTRVSIGVQSFEEAEAAAGGRAQRTADVEAALGHLREAGFRALNVDLMYGLPGQTVESWLRSLRRALQFAPEELYLYPLYVRPLTGLDGRGPAADLRPELYRAGRDLLRAEGYVQLSMRMFRRADAPGEGGSEGPEFCCQQDGMIGLGCGARSYTRALHYSSEYAVRRPAVRQVIHEYLDRSDEEFGRAAYGFRLDPAEQRRRFVIKSLLRAEGLDLHRYAAVFGTGAPDEFPELGQLSELGLAERRNGSLVLTDAGLERSDAIGPWLYSESVRRLSAGFPLR